MDQNQLKKVASIFNRCFIVITALCYFTVESYLEKAGIVLLGRSSRGFHEPFPSFSIILLLLVSIHFYSRKKDPSNIFGISYLLLICLITGLILLPVGYSKYIELYSAFGSWIYHVILCVIFVVWNFAVVGYKYYMKKRTVSRISGIEDRKTPR